ELEEGADPGKFTVERLRFYLAGEPTVAYNTYRILRQTAEAVELRFSRSRKRLLPPEIIRPVGLGDDEEILPYPGISFPGYRLLSEYFAFPEKFLFLDFVDLGTLDLEPGESSFEIEVRFRKRPPSSFRPTKENFRLYATPIVNLFPREGEPVAVTHLKTAAAVLADYTHPEAFEVISVDEVAGLRKGDRSSRSHLSFFSFEHGRGAGDGGDGVYYHVTHHISPAGRWVTRLSLVSPERGQLPREETLSLRLTCMNGRLCREVGIEDVRVAGGERPDFVTFRNVTRPTEPIYPQIGEGAEWRFISHMALNHLSLGDAAALRSVLSLYDVGDRPANRRRIEALKASRVRPREILLRGAPVRGTELTLEVDETHFDDEGDLLIFSEVLNEFFSLYSSINSFTELIIHRRPSGEVLRCPAIAGKQSLI
ncbi:MAG: type VI secretion system baseplate subunit TssF, partial [bacterium]|nr:type VI secretion system baseplate subunit TssF [bacterium]